MTAAGLERFIGKRPAGLATLIVMVGRGACAEPAPVPPPPAATVEVKRPDDPIPALGALTDVEDQAKALHLRFPKYDRFFRVPGDVAFASIRNHYDTRLAGWRRVDRFPRTIKGGPAAAWTGGGQVFIVTLIPHADRRVEGGGPDQLLITFSSKA